MDAELVERERLEIGDDAVVELLIWLLPAPTRGSAHPYKYRLAFVLKDECVVRFDNEAGKGDHKHVGKREVRYNFVDLDTLRVDFWTEVELWLQTR